jgi:midasin (ATPase involved in ribosome maturation)
MDFDLDNWKDTEISRLRCILEKQQLKIRSLEFRNFIATNCAISLLIICFLIILI